MRSEEISRRVAIKALQKMFLEFTGRPLAEDQANRLIEQTKNEVW